MVIAIDLDGNFIKEWKSAKDVELELGWNPDYISLVARNKKKNYKNYLWKFKNGITKE